MTGSRGASSKGGKLVEPVAIVSHLVDDDEGGASHSWRDVGRTQCLQWADLMRSGVLDKGFTRLEVWSGEGSKHDFPTQHFALLRL